MPTHFTVKSCSLTQRRRAAGVCMSVPSRFLSASPRLCVRRSSLRPKAAYPRSSAFICGFVRSVFSVFSVAEQRDKWQARVRLEGGDNAGQL